MKANERRKVFDAVDLLTEDTAVSVPATKVKNGVTMLSIDSIFQRLYDNVLKIYLKKEKSQRYFVQVRW